MAARNTGQLLFTCISVLAGDTDAKDTENPGRVCARCGKKNIKIGTFAKHLQSISTEAMYHAFHFSGVLKTYRVMNWVKAGGKT